MKLLERYTEVVTGSHLLALATCAGGPRVRVMNYCCRAEEPGIVYVSTDRTNQKTKDFAQNPAVAFTTIPASEEEGSHIRAVGRVKRCGKTIWEMKEVFLPQNPGMEDALEHIGDALEVYEIHFASATLEGGFAEAESITF